MPSSERLDAAAACRRYEEIRPRLPKARFPAVSQAVPDLAALIGEFDVFVLDGYGVLNVGEAPIAGAPERLAQLRAAGKQVFVLTNGASYSAGRAVERYRRLGFDFAPAEVVSSRDVLDRALGARRGWRWGAVATPVSGVEEITESAYLLGDDPAGHDRADGFLMLSTSVWNHRRHALMLASLHADPRPVLVGNPDLVAPREDGLSAEPGLYAHEIMDLTGIVPEFYGKPFGNAFDLVAERIPAGTPRHRIAMVGDTPWTDILGAAAMGWRTVLVTGHGLVKGMSPAGIDALTDIRADFVAATT